METETKQRQPKGFKSEQYGTASDGTPLHWQIKEPAGGGVHPVVLSFHGGGFWSGFPFDTHNSILCADDLVAQGFLVLAPEYELAPTGKLVGQITDGRYPRQTECIELAAAAAIARGNGSVQSVGGSTGGCWAAWLAAKGICSGVALSPATQLDDPESLLTAGFNGNVTNYAPGDLLEASPNHYVNSKSRPVYIASFEKDNMPPRQYTLGVAAWKAAGIEVQSVLIPGRGHAWPAWPIVKTQAIAFLNAHK